MNPTQLNQEVSGAQRLGSQLQSQYNAQSKQQYGAYTGAQKQANQAYQNLGSYNKYLQGAGSGANLYNTGVTQAEQAQGFDPATLATATQNLTRTQNALAASQAAAQSSTGGYGLSGAQLGNYYATQQQPLAQQGQAQSTAVGNLQQLYQNALTSGQNYTGAQLQSQGLVSQNMQSQYQNAVSQMQTTGQTLTEIQKLQQQQGYLTAQQVSAYQNAYSGYVSAQASMRQAAASALSAQASMIGAQAQAGLYNQQAAQIAQQIKLANQRSASPTPGLSSGGGINLRGSLQPTGGGIKLQ